MIPDKTYKKLTQDDSYIGRRLDDPQYEFGVPGRYVMYHKQEDGKIIVSHNGNRLVEFHPDNSAYIYFSDNYYSGYTNRLNELFNISFGTNKFKTAAGIQKIRLRVWGCGTLDGSYTCERRMQIINTDGQYEFKAADEKSTSIEKDNVKYREFNRKLKTFKATLSAQTRMNVYDGFLIGDKNWYHDNHDACKTVIDSLGNYHNYDDLLYSNATNWIETRKPEHLTNFVALSIRAFSANGQSKHHVIQRRVTAGLKLVQTRFLRENCVKLSESNFGLTAHHASDTDGLVLPPPRLREVQVPGEAQIC